MPWSKIGAKNGLKTTFGLLKTLHLETLVILSKALMVYSHFDILCTVLLLYVYFSCGEDLALTLNRFYS